MISKKIFVLVLILFFSPAGFSETKKLASDVPLRKLFVELGKRVNPAVVNIFTTQVVRSPYGRGYRGGPPGMPVDPFDQFMQEFMGQGPGGGGRGGEQRAASLGSGFIIDESGLILTNFHVIQNASEIQVQLTEKSKKTIKAKVVGKDERTDIALIKINYDGKLSSIPLGDSDSLEVGEWVAAFGNPFGHGHSMTKGIVSAKERDVDIENAPSFPFIQTDASINPGNSGGPLVNDVGEVIGVNSAIDARAQGIGFAIPINVVKKLLPELKSKGKITRGFLGVGIINLDEKMVKEFNLKSDKGALVTGITPGSPAHTAGIQPYDVIVEYNGKEIEDAKQLMNLVGETKIGQSVGAKVIRDGTAKKVTIKITERGDGSVAQMAPQRSAPQGKAVANIGISIMDLNPTLARQLELSPEIKKGVVIVGVKQASVAEQAGLQIGDVILDINKKPVTTTTDAIKRFDKVSNSLRILRGQTTMLVFMGAE